ncbi:aminoglycoside phosphotransferase family protein [Paenalkalicoccus suaedae]|uniref:Aminoglycoside phosphotransferase family protein n=1 Tax=Paenalkalicoccus suaedae TaxID=2592382 RepID=A0A859FBG6_9BACI|nr:aminoglycoside phosphotransferase family protein [Paenalkalicoccus suaedae]QKS70300.1 aminoglycoside phosphotransferase family protein [Paenalkalicoccus suaedae]
MNIDFINQLQLKSRCTEVIEIKKGFSTDKKYLVHMEDGQKLLLRLFDGRELESKKAEFRILERMQEYKITCSQPILIGEVEGQGYSVTSYLDGNDAEDEISTYSEVEQYKLGLRAGEELRRMHQLEAPPDISSWYERKVEKHQRYIEAYLACDVKVQNDHTIMEFIDQNIHLMKHRPNLFQHDDYHVSNIIVSNKEFVGVVDFGRFDWGDPYHEFLKVGIFTRGVSIPFSRGQIRGYFYNEDPDDEFWRLYSLYLAMCVFSTVIWTLKVIPDSLDEMLDKVYTYLDDHDYFRRITPKWY